MQYMVAAVVKVFFFFTLILCTSEQERIETSHFSEHVGHGYPIPDS